ncbi:MAG: putative lipid II flippase FtsW [Oscillospiraceae bacterium]|nr:putative lipid II flippase FtsW [Oscillospiraceae bacterium]
MGNRLPNQNTQEKVLLDERGMLDLPYLVLTVILVAIGLIMLFSASYASAVDDGLSPTYYFVRQAGFAVVGIVVMLLVSRVNYQAWRFFAFWVLGGAVLLLLAVAVPGIGVSHNGARRWLRLGIEFQPSEFAKLGVVLTFAATMSVYRDKMKTFRYGVLPFAGILGVLAVLLYLEPHMSATIILLLLGAIMMFLGGTRLRWFAIGAAGAIALVLIYLATKGYASDRIMAWKDPFAYAKDEGYQIVQSLYAIGSGGLFGLGFGRGRQKYLYLPEPQNDYLFAIVCEELGLVGALLVLLLFVLLIVRGYWIALHARDRFGAMLVAGLTTLLALQVFFNIGVVTNFLPATGISLPFFSYGGTALVLQLLEMGIVLSVSRWNTMQLI